MKCRQVACTTKDLHSGVYGGTIPEAMNDICRIMGSLVDSKGKIQVPGIYDLVRNTYSTNTCSSSTTQIAMYHDTRYQHNSDSRWQITAVPLQSRICRVF